MSIRDEPWAKQNSQTVASRFINHVWHGFGVSKTLNSGQSRQNSAVGSHNCLMILKFSEMASREVQEAVEGRVFLVSTIVRPCPHYYAHCPPADA